MIDLLLRSARVFQGGGLTDIAIDDGLIVEKGSRLDCNSSQELDLDGRLVVPGFVDPHVHLDIALINSWQRPGRLKPFLSMGDLLEAIEGRRKEFTGEDIRQRASAALELASRHGITAMRAQCHVDPLVGLKHLEALLAVREKYAERVTLQIVAFPHQGLLGKPGTLDLFRESFRMGADVMGCACINDVGADGKMIDFRKHIDAALDLAMALDVDIDIHADLGIPDHIELDELEIVYMARRAIEVGYQGRVAAGHVCALGSATPEVAAQAIGIMKEAQVNVVSQPDLYRLGRRDTQHVRRGLTRVKELLKAGVNVTYASNNVRDVLRPLGNFNPLEEALILCYGAHMDTIEELETLLRMSTYNSARALRLEGYGLDVGCKADMVVLDAPSASAAIVGQSEKRYVFKGGRLMASSYVVSDLFNGTQMASIKKE